MGSLLLPPITHGPPHPTFSTPENLSPLAPFSVSLIEERERNGICTPVFLFPSLRQA